MSPTKQAKSQGNSGKEPKLHQNGEKKTLGETRLSRGPNGVAYSSISRGNTHLKSIWKMRPNPFAAHIQQYVTVASEIHTDKTVSEDKRQDMTI